MTNKLIRPVAYIATTILTFIFMALDYLKAFVIYDGESESEGYTAYEYLDLNLRGAEAEILQELACFALVIVIIAAVVLALVAVAKLLSAFDICVDILSKFERPIDIVGTLASVVMILCNVLALFSTILFGLLNFEEMFDVVFLMTAGVGAYLMLVISVIPVIAKKIEG